MNRIALTILLSLVSLSLIAKDGLTVTGGTKTPMELIAASGTGIETVYVLNTMASAKIEYVSTSTTVVFYRYQNSMGDRVPITPSKTTNPTDGKTYYKIENPIDLIEDRGYQIEDGTTTTIWLIDYSVHRPIIHSLEAAPDGLDCETKDIKLLINKSDDLYYSDIRGSKHRIPRDYEISYNTQEWKGDDDHYQLATKTITERDLGTETTVPAPLLDTEFTITGDQFGEYFTSSITHTSPLYKATVASGHIVYEKVDRDAENELENVAGQLDGSAPIEVNFYGYSNEPATEHYTWFIYKIPDLTNYIARYTDQDINYEFNESATYRVVLEVADINSTCVDTTSIQFRLTESKLEIPNYFSPGDSPGSNDEFRVAYRSLATFKCTIFNRWGNKLYQWNDPAKGWDGKYKGKYVSPGVYFYVIEAVGTDGERYKKGGDINILRSKQ